ncbi:hypothetical protein B296_00034999 [Ensete ventricosum]|uniref:Uncharacterized protein n=1 Tax=Ensete ventricosum TaxID=4639 RepID=A0A426X6A6_ENSVE|nr:hypothetical protein B296_00034999 [Ensete ventricosum]
MNRAQSRVRSIFRASSRKFKILAIPAVLAHESSSIDFSCINSEIQNTGHSYRISP